MNGSAGQPRRPTRRWGAAALRAWWDASPKRWSPIELWSLVWLVFLVYPLLFDPTASAAVYVLSVVLMVAYAAFYLAATLRPGPLQRWAPWITTAVAVVVTPFNAGAAVLLVYAAGLVGAFRPRREALRWFVGFTALIMLFTALSPIPLPWLFFAFGPPAVLVWVIGLICAESAADARAAQLRSAQVGHLATVAERERIARDLHDLLGQTLTGIVVRSQLAQRLTAADPAAGIAEMAAVEQAARAALGEVRTTVSGWRHVELDAELAAAADALGAAGVELNVARDPDLVLTPSAETALGLALREAITNVVRHSRATRCTVHLGGAGELVTLRVTDDGVGGGAPDGNGLTGMRERIAALGGEVHRAGHAGTSLLVSVPTAVAT